MKRKLYPCEIPECTNMVPLRSRIKSGKYKGLKACPFHKGMYDRQIARITKKTKERRRLERKELPDFFKAKIELLKTNPVCDNCGVKINPYSHPINNIAHILPKSRYKSVMTHDWNFLFLCDSKDNKDGHSCHRMFDDSKSEWPSMPVFQKVINRYAMFKDKVEEMGNERLMLDDYVSKL